MGPVSYYKERIVKFVCIDDCYSNILQRGFRMGLVYDLNAEEMEKMKGTDEKPGHFPRRFEPADHDAKLFMENYFATKQEAKDPKAPKAPKAPKETDKKDKE